MTLAELRTIVNNPSLDPRKNMIVVLNGSACSLRSVVEGHTEIYLRNVVK